MLFIHNNPDVCLNVYFYVSIITEPYHSSNETGIKEYEQGKQTWPLCFYPWYSRMNRQRGYISRFYAKIYFCWKPKKKHCYFR